MYIVWCHFQWCWVTFDISYLLQPFQVWFLHSFAVSLLSNRHHLSCCGCLDAKREDNQNCSVLCTLHASVSSCIHYALVRFRFREDRLQNDLYCVDWGVKLYSNQPTDCALDISSVLLVSFDQFSFELFDSLCGVYTAPAKRLHGWVECLWSSDILVTKIILVLVLVSFQSNRFYFISYC